MKTSESVKINKGVKNGYLLRGGPVGGYEGRILNIYKMGGEITVEIEFDSISLRQMPDKYIKALIKDETDFTCLDLDIDDVTVCIPRDTPEDVLAARKEICEKFDYVSILDEGEFDFSDEEVIDSENLEENEPNEEGEVAMHVALARTKAFEKAFREFHKKLQEDNKENLRKMN